jgi:multidrug efflux system outer membrane protein
MKRESGFRPWRSLGLCGLVAIVAALAGCAAGPNYQRPELGVPAAFRGQAGASTNSLADLPWWQVFHDEPLQKLVRVALTNNYDLRVAFTRVEQARALAAAARAGFFPRLNYAAVGGRGKNVGVSGQPAPTGTSGSAFGADLNASWEIDLWGRVRRLDEAARADYLASQEARRDMTISVVALVAQDYFQLLALERELAIARDTTNSYGQSLKIFTQRLRGGVASKLESSSAEGLMETAAATIPELERQIAMQENQISVLLGRNPGPVMLGKVPLDEQLPPEVPAGLPAKLIERRPDVLEAEQQLRSANAQVGVAKANFFPQLSLSGLYGRVSPELSAFTGGGAAAWSAAAGLTGPIFQGGLLRAQFERTKAVREQYSLQYQAAVLNALAEVSNALISREKLAEERTRQTQAVAAYKEALRIATERYRLGNASYYEVLQEQQQLFPAENALAQTELNQLLAVVQLYRALGGGWTESAPAGK